MMKTFFTYPLLNRFFLLLLAIGPFLAACGDTTTEKFAKELRKKEDEYKVIDETKIQAYLVKNNITEFTRLPSGLFMVPIVNGTGPQVKAGNRVAVKYRGTLLENGVVFDSSFDRRIQCDCGEFLIGSGEVIKGWDQAFVEMKKGDRKTLIIPSYLAYGPTGKPNAAGSYDILPNQVLIFDVEITDIR
ncbi:peptidylprolyl isomerase FKBP-type [Hymenobacter roseosalivarius DSM 11622]|uniref:Peptidyl-prolyl cis-trans isomerase n=1 Tax=Hymenobacter roseosalivarius DSM 11622 TaxID=645990 RepID=A0A1W1V3I4_9BACT|nr:FKBP-type peptidyl-prolyl cis-trans isomerase [Hymenobacter roseosalivarius]SMB87614.1 peptidylprolyl isomerase FKBP-type [Hymenobacter roseosalivarius DSM 11622]